MNEESAKIFRRHMEEMFTLSDAEFDHICSHFSVKKLRKHQFVIQVDDPVRYEYFVLNGSLKAYVINEDSKMHILQFAMQNWWITDYQSYYKGTNSKLYIDCIEDTEMLCISLENKDKLCNEMHKIEHFFRKKTNAGYVALQQRILSLLTSTPKEKYEQLLTQYPQLFQKVPKQLIAAYLGVSRETLSRLYAVEK
jgi:CRP-like cAMP-binding protein